MFSWLLFLENNSPDYFHIPSCFEELPEMESCPMYVQRSLSLCKGILVLGMFVSEFKHMAPSV